MEKRKNVTSACDSCRRHKSKCDCLTPCSQCRKYGRLCVYSPRRKRGPPPKPTSGRADSLGEELLPLNTQSSSSFIVNYYLSVMLGNISGLFQLNDSDLISDSSVGVTELPEAKKLQFFACLATCARCTGNHRLAEKLFEHARRISQKFFDQTDELEAPFPAALGFALMGLYCEPTNVKRANRYLLIADSIISQAKSPDNDLKYPVKFFVQLIRSCTTPFMPGLSLSWPIPSPENANTKATPFLTQSIKLPSVFNFDLSTVNPFVPQSFLEQDIYFSPLSQEMVDALPPIFLLEFVFYSRILLEHYCENLRLLLGEQIIKEEYFDLPSNCIPEPVARAMVNRLEFVTMRKETGLTPLTGGVGNAVSAAFSYLSGNSKAALTSIHKFIRVCYSSENQEMVLLSPSYTIPKCCLIGGYFLLLMGDLENFEKLFILLSFYARIGYLTAVTGIKALESLRAKLHPGTGFKEEPSEEIRLALDFTQRLGEDPRLPLINSFTVWQQENPGDMMLSEVAGTSASTIHTPSSRDLSSDIEESETLEEASPNGNPMDVFYSLLEQGNEQKLLEELGSIFKGDQFEEFGPTMLS